MLSYVLKRVGLICLSLFVSGGVASAAEPWSPNDVSILLPLPAHDQDPALFSPNTRGAAGELLPARVLSLLPSLVTTVDPAMIVRHLKVVAIRIDPCFPGSVPSHSQTCQPQIRMIWQPVFRNANGVLTVDAALHTFYDLTVPEFRQLMSAMVALKQSAGVSTRGRPLGVHPAIAVQGLRGRFWKGLAQIFLSASGEARLSRMTFMTLESPNQMWDFGGFDLTRGQGARPMVIPRVEARKQSFINTLDPRLGFRGGARPEPQGGDTFNRMMASSQLLTPGDAQVLRESVDAIHRIENPRLHSPATIDCVSCHVAQPARLWAAGRFPQLGLDQSPHRFTSPMNLENRSPFKQFGNVVRAFGYQGNAVALSHRAIHESAAVAEALNRDRMRRR